MKQTTPVSIDLQQDRLCSVQQLCQARLGQSVSAATIWRWINRGTAGGKLAAVHVNGRWHSTEQAFADFIRRQTEARLKGPRAGRTGPSNEQLAAAGLLPPQTHASALGGTA